MGVSWVGATAGQIATAVRRGDATATQVIADHIEHALLADRVVEGLRTLRAGEAIAEAEQVDEQPDLGALPLAGVPVLVSEDTAVAALPTWNGSAAARTSVSARDHEVVRRLRGTGAIVLAVSRISEFGLWATTDDPSAITRNPWRTDRSPGGAAGGAAAAVAAGIAPVAQATDGFGSLRVPAACCGLVGFKPGYALLDTVADWFGVSEHGVLATTVDDAAAGFAALAGRPLAGPELPGRLRVAVSVHTPLPGVIADADVRDGVARAARALVALGYDAVAADPPYPVRLPMMATATWSAVAHRAVAGRAGDHGGGSDAALAVQARTRRQAALGSQVVRRRMVREGERLDWREACAAWMRDGGFDLVLMPTVAGPSPAAGYWSDRSWRANVAATMRLTAFTAPWNLAGLPALTLPTGPRRDGLPGAVQLVGPPGAEDLLFAAAAALEYQLPWRRFAPSWPRDPGAHLRERTAAYPIVTSASAPRTA